jgi:cell division protein FtsL
MGTFVKIAPRESIRGRRFSIFSVILLLFVLVTAIVIYTSNTIAINALVVEISGLKVEHEKISSSNAALTAMVHKLSSSDRIGQIASQKLQMIYLKQQPTSLEIDKSTLQPH